MIDNELAPVFEEVRQRLLAFGPIEDVLLVDFDPGELAPLPAQVIPKPGEFLFLRQEFRSLGKPFVAGHNRMILDTHRSPRRVIIFYQLVEYKLDQVYGAIADPTRRAILAVLAQGDANVGSLVDRFTISFNGVSKHVKVLERAGLVERAIHGREHRLTLNPAPLREAARWLEHYRAFWEMRLDGLEAFLAKQQRSTTAGRARTTRQTGKDGT